MSLIRKEPITGPAAWKGVDLAGDTSWLHPLSAQVMATLDAALAHAAKRAGLGENPRVTEYPRHKEFIEALQEILERRLPGAARSVRGPLGDLAGRLETDLRSLRSFNDPAGVYARLPLGITVR